jgi:outer membrane protein assembly factor BamD
MRRAVLLLSLSLCACAGNTNKNEEDAVIDGEEGGDPTERTPQGGRPENVPSVNYANTAEENWKLAEQAFADEDYLVAQRYYSYIRNKFPYSQFASQAAMRIGDCQYARERYIESIDSYQNFVRLYPTHERVAYAALRIGLSYYNQIPTDWFMLPPPEEKEQTAVRDAERSLRDYVERFPKDAGIAEGKAALLDVRKKLLAHEKYVAGFYANLGKDRAEVGRLEVIRRDFKDVGVDDELLADIADLWSRIGELDRAKSALKELEQKFPASPRLAETREAVGRAAAPATKTSTQSASG